MKRILFFLTVAFALKASAQNARQDTLFLDSARILQISQYKSLIGANSRLYNGIQYKEYLADNQEHPFFLADEWLVGSITYDDESYEDINMYYDISRDKVITEHDPSGGKIEMISSKVKRFTIDGHPFVHLQGDSAGIINKAFYEVLYDGTVKLYALRQKQLQNKTDMGQIVHYFSVHNKLFIFKDGHYAAVRSKRSVYAVLSDHRKAVASSVRAKKVKFRRQREKAIETLVQEYDHQNQ